jgi:hypothetical protein
MDPLKSRRLTSPELHAVRARSKALLGSLYRAEVASAIGQWAAHDEWTTADLEERLAGADIPKSCIAKELSTLLDWEVILRYDRDARGYFRFMRSEFDEFWRTASVLARPGLPEAAHPASTVAPLRRGRKSDPS